MPAYVVLFRESPVRDAAEMQKYLELGAQSGAPGADGQGWADARRAGFWRDGLLCETRERARRGGHRGRRAGVTCTRVRASPAAAAVGPLTASAKAPPGAKVNASPTPAKATRLSMS